MTEQLMPAAFLGHGSPMNALERNAYTAAWRGLGAAAPRPRAILVVSAHWYINATAVTAMARPRTIHDFYGFPEELFAVRYAAPGAPEVAQEVADVAQPTWIGQDQDSWGLDHGAWSVLMHAFPDADIPVVQLAINAMKPLAYHFELGASLAPLRQRGVLILASGNVVHNLGRIDPGLGDAGTDWAQRFDKATQVAMTSSAGAAVDLQAHPDFDMAAPTPDHFIPLLYLAGLSAAAGRPAQVLIEGYAYGSLSMTSYTLDAPALPAGLEGSGAAGLPSTMPADDTNA